MGNLLLNFGAVKTWQNTINAILFFAACAMAGAAMFFLFFMVFKPIAGKVQPTVSAPGSVDAVFKEISLLGSKHEREKFLEATNRLREFLPDAIGVFGKKITGGSESEREAALQALGESGDRRALPILVEAARTVSDPVLRARLLELAGKIGWFQDAFLLEQIPAFLKDRNGVVTNAAAYALLSIGCEEGRLTLLDNLKSSESATRLGAVERLDRTASFESAGLLADLLPEKPVSASDILLARKITETMTVFRYLPPRHKIASYLRHGNLVLRGFAVEYLLKLKPVDTLKEAEEAFGLWRENPQTKDNPAEQLLLMQLAAVICSLKAATVEEIFPAREVLLQFSRDSRLEMAEFAIARMMGSGDKFFVPALIKIIRESDKDNLLRDANKALQGLTYANFLHPEKQNFTREEAVTLWEDWWARHKTESRRAWLRLSIDRDFALMIMNQVNGIPPGEIFTRIFEPDIRPLVYRTFAYTASRNKEDFEYCLYRWQNWWKEKRALTRNDWRRDELDFAVGLLNASDPDLRSWACGRLMSESLFPPVQSRIFWRNAPEDIRRRAALYWKNQYEKFRDNPDFAPVGDEY